MGLAFDEGSAPPLVAVFSMCCAFRYAVVKGNNTSAWPCKRIVKRRMRIHHFQTGWIRADKQIG
jgi:hypothetical protein